MTTTVRKAASVFMAVLLCLGVAFSAAPGIFGGTAYAYTLNGSMTDGATLTVSGAQEGGKVDAIKMFDAVPTTDGEGATYTVASEWNGFFTTKNLGSDYNNDPYAYVQGLEDEKDKTKIAEFAAKAVKWMGEQSFTGATATVSGGTATLNSLDYGYYLVLPYTGSEPAEPYSDAMLLNVLEKNVTAAVKAEWPTVDKTIVDNPEGGLGNLGIAVDDSWVDVPMEVESLTPYAEPTGGANGTSANVGDTLTFKLESKVPDMSGYSNYTFKLHDKLSAGLTLLNSAIDPKVVVKIGESDLDGDDYEVTGNLEDDGTTTLTIDLSKYLTAHKNDSGFVGKTIKVYYQAKVNDKAAVEDPVTNEVSVEYSNDPSSDGTGTSTPDKTYTYTFGFDLKKVAKDDNDALLSGAQFEIYRDGGNGNWDNGSSDDTGLTFTGSESNWKLSETQSGATELTTGTNGLLSLDGLSEGTYWVLETEAPDGYNKLPAPIKVVISATYGEDGELTGHVIDYGDNANGVSGDSQGTDAVHDGGHVITVENSKGALLPTTGGMGTIGLTVLGVIIVAAGAIWIIRRNRKGNQR